MSRVILALIALAISASAKANPPIRELGFISYDMPNGSGVASGGSFNHWDFFYSGDGDTTTDGAPLSNGIGELADGNPALHAAHVIESVSGLGPWTGWAATTTPSPELLFRLPVTADGRFLIITSIDVHIDNSQINRAFAPSDIRINGISTPFVAPAPGSFGWVTLLAPHGANTRTNSVVSVQLLHDTNPAAGWVFASEVRFFGSPSPEPATWAMMVMGFGLVGSALRRRRCRPDEDAPASPSAS